MGGRSERRTDELDPETDAIDRFERMVNTQIHTLEGIDDKAARITRFLTLLIGVVFTGLSLMSRVGSPRFEVASEMAFVAFGIGVLSLVVSLGFAVVTMLSSAFEYGPDEAIGNYLARYYVPHNRYKSVLLQSYHTAIRKNRIVVQTNARRFRNSLAALIVGVIAFSLGGMFLVTPLGFETELAIFVITVLATGRLFVYVVAEEYLTLDYQITAHE